MSGEKFCVLVAAMAPWLVSLLGQHCPSCGVWGHCQRKFSLWYWIYCMTECFGKQNEAFASLNNPSSPTAVIVFVIFYGLSYNTLGYCPTEDVTTLLKWNTCVCSLLTEPPEQGQMRLCAFLSIIFWFFFYFCNKEWRKKKKKKRSKTNLHIDLGLQGEE